MTPEVYKAYKAKFKPKASIMMQHARLWIASCIIFDIVKGIDDAEADAEKKANWKAIEKSTRRCVKTHLHKHCLSPRMEKELERMVSRVNQMIEEHIPPHTTDGHELDRFCIVALVGVTLMMDAIALSPYFCRSTHASDKRYHDHRQYPFLKDWGDLRETMAEVQENHYQFYRRPRVQRRV